MDHARNGSTTPPKDPKKFGTPLPPAPTSETGRTLVLCFDGTANEFDDTNTNVVKLVAMLEKESPKQLVYYQVSQFYCTDPKSVVVLTTLQTGVGTYTSPGVFGPLSTWIAKTADLGVAWYLDAHVMGGYKFLQSTWERGDRICAYYPSIRSYVGTNLVRLYRLQACLGSHEEHTRLVLSLVCCTRCVLVRQCIFTIIYMSELICICVQVGLLPREMNEQVDFAYSIFKSG